MTTKRTGGFNPKIVKPSLLQTFLYKWKLLRQALRGTPKGIPSNAKVIQGHPLSVMRGGKVEIRERDKTTEYNPREFRADKGPRK